MDGGHDIDRCAEVTEATLNAVYDELFAQEVALEGTILKPNMVISGKDCGSQAGVDEVAAKTVSILRRAVPAAVPGIMFLSGGQSEAHASEHLNAMNAQYSGLPWKLSFSYGRALQESALKAWSGKAENTATAQKQLLERARLNSAACAAEYMEAAA